jgi:hypothetical protein
MTFGLVVDPTPKMPIQAALSRPPPSVSRRLHTSATGPQNLQTETVATSGTSPSPPYIMGRSHLLTTALFNDLTGQGIRWIEEKAPTRLSAQSKAPEPFQTQFV